MIEAGTGMMPCNPRAKRSGGPPGRIRKNVPGRLPGSVRKTFRPGAGRFKGAFMESILTKVVRILLGLLLVVAGLNKFLQFMPNPPHNDAATAFMGALAATGYMMPVIAVVEILCGAAFLAGRYVALAALLLAPVALNIVMFHAMLDASGAGPGFFVGIADAYLLAVSYPKYRDLLTPR
jgi:putative oxidoreductase